MTFAEVTALCLSHSRVCGQTNIYEKSRLYHKRRRRKVTNCWLTDGEWIMIRVNLKVVLRKSLRVAHKIVQSNKSFEEYNCVCLYYFCSPAVYIY